MTLRAWNCKNGRAILPSIVTWQFSRRVSFRGKILSSCFGHVEFEMYMGHPVRNIQEAICGVGLVFMRDNRAGYIDWWVICIKVAIECMGASKVTKWDKVEQRRRPRAEPWDIPIVRRHNMDVRLIKNCPVLQLGGDHKKKNREDRVSRRKWGG